MPDGKHLDEDVTQIASEEDISRNERFDLPGKKEPEEEPEEATPTEQRRLSLGTLRDRSVAAFLDLLFCGYLFCGTFLFFNVLFRGDFLSPYPTIGLPALWFHTIAGTVLFLYYFLSEAIFHTTLGKFLCRLTVRKTSGRLPALLGIFLRNLLRPLDLVLALFPTWILLERTRKQQRLGDLIAGTCVMKQYASLPRTARTVGEGPNPSRRFLTDLGDHLVVALWLAGFLLWLDYQRPLFSFLALISLPLLYFVWQTIWWRVFQQTPVQWLFGAGIANESGGPVRFSQAVLRSLAFFGDLLFFPAIFLSKRRQSFSDFVAATTVVTQNRLSKTAKGIAAALVILGLTWFVGLSNPRNITTPFFKADFFTQLFGPQQALGRTNIKEALKIDRFAFLKEDRTTPRGSAEFDAGEMIYFAFDVTGYAARDGKAWIVEDLVLRFPDHTIGFKKQGTAEYHETPKEAGKPIEFFNPLKLPADAKPGFYTLVLILHDRIANTERTEQRTFRVR